MYSKILVVHECLEDALRALDKAAALAAAIRAQLLVLGILTPGPDPVLGHHKSVEELEGSLEFRQLQEQARTWANQQKVRAEVYVRVGHAIRLIERVAEESGADLVVLGDTSHIGGWGRMLEGSTDRVATRTRCDVLIVR